MTTETEDRLARAREQGQAQFESIVELVEALNAANRERYGDRRDHAVLEQAWEDAERAIHEDALSVEVRSDWYSPGQSDADTKPAEYRILLCTGGPAAQICGKLSEHGEPLSAHLEVQDWFTSWTLFWPSQHEHTHAEETLLTYARCFYFGE